MKKKADWPILNCEMCIHTIYSPINDVICKKTNRYLWLNNNKLPNGKNKPYKYMPRWCPLKPFKLKIGVKI